MPTLTERLDIILINLKVLSKLNVTDRPIFSENMVCIRPYWPYITPIIRTISGESRNDIIYGLKSLMEDIERIYSDLLDELQLNKYNSINNLNSLNNLNVSKLSESNILFHSPKESPVSSPSNSPLNNIVMSDNNNNYPINNLRLNILEAEYTVMHLTRLKTELPKIFDSNQRGLNALVSTYERSPETMSQLDNIISNFKILNKKIENKIKELNIIYNLNI